MDDLDKQIEDAKERLKKTQQLAELNLLQKQAAAISPTAQANNNDPMQKMLKWAFPAGIGLLVIALVFYLPLHNFEIGLFLGALSAAIIGFKVALTPSIRIPIIDDRKKKAEVKT